MDFLGLKRKLSRTAKQSLQVLVISHHLGRPKHRRENNIKMDIPEVG
jgi:hypothetical protein